MILPRVAAASLSGESDSEWARRAAPYVGTAVLGGIALDRRSREAARTLVARDRNEFLPEDPIDWIDRQLGALEDVSIRPAVNVRSATIDPVREAAAVCTAHDAILEVNAHCRQPELRAVGCGETLLADTDRLCQYVRAAAGKGATVSVKTRAEVGGVDLPAVATAVDQAGAEIVHVDAMDSEPIIEAVSAAVDCFVIANNEVRGEASVREYLEYGADAVSVGRPSDDPRVLERVRDATEAWFAPEIDG